MARNVRSLWLGAPLLFCVIQLLITVADPSVYKCSKIVPFSKSEEKITFWKLQKVHAGTLLPIPPAGHAKVLVSDIIHVVPGNSSWYTWQIKVWVLNAWIFSVKMGSWTIKWKIAYNPSEKGGGVIVYSHPKVETFYTMPYDVSRINARALLRDVFRQRWMFYKEGDKDKRNRLAFLVLLNRPLDNR